MSVTDAVRRWADRQGYLAAFAPAVVLGYVDDRIDGLEASGAFAPGFAQANLQAFRGASTAAAGRFGTVVVLAVPRPAWVVRFATASGPVVDAIVPPTYVDYRPLFEEIRIGIVDALGGAVAVETIAVPLKSLAAAIGLVSYGRNNLTYVPGYGSYVQLVAYALDAAPEHSLPEVEFERMLDRCATCRACVKACPTGAIDGDRFLLHADRCYTLASESSQPLPLGMRPPSPDCLIGCLICQEVCPVNRGLLECRPSEVSFTREETDALLSPGDLPTGLQQERILAKFAALAITEGLPVLRRNLRQLIALASEPRRRRGASARPRSSA